MVGLIAMVIGLLSILLAATGSTSLLHPDSRADAAVTFGVTASAGTVATMLVAGFGDLFRPAVVLALLGAWALAAGLAARRWGRPFPAFRIADFTVWRRHPWSAALVALAAAALSWQILVALVLPPYAYDALTYHLTTVATWVQRGNLALSQFSRCCAYYPLTPELLVAFPALLLHNNSLVGLVQVPFVLLGAAATAGLARIVGLSRSAAAAAGALFVVTPTVLTQAPTNYVDVTFAALVLASLYGVTRYATTGAAQHLVVGGLAAGLVLGTKGIGLLWTVALFGAAVIAASIAVYRGHIRAAAAAKTIGVAVAAGFALGGWWYLRNIAITGNPLYPFSIRIFGHTVFSGPFEIGETLTVPSAGAGAPWPASVVLSWASDLDFWHQGSYDYQQRLGGLGPLWAWLGIPLLAAMLVVILRRRSIALLPVAAVLLVFIVQPYSWWARFTLPLAALGAIAIALAASRAPWQWFRAAVQLSAFVLAAVGVVMSSYAVDPAGRAEDLPAARVLALIGKPQEERSLERLFHHEYGFLDQVPEDATIVVDLDAERVRFVSPLFGPGFTRRILPSDTGRIPTDAWIVTSARRPLDSAAFATHVLVWDVRGVRVWRPQSQ